MSALLAHLLAFLLNFLYILPCMYCNVDSNENEQKDVEFIGWLDTLTMQPHLQ